MKKTAISLLLVLALVLCVVLVTAPTTQATEFSHTSSSGHEGWTSLNDYLADYATNPSNYSTAKPSINNQSITVINLPAGNYYLESDLTLPAPIRATVNTTVTVCMRGFNLKGKTVNAGDGNGRVVCQTVTGTLNICDCGTTGSISANVSGSSLYGGAMWVAAGTVNLYSGTVYNSGTMYWGGNVHVNGGTFAVHGGTIKDGKATGRGGNICVGSANLLLNGGIITGGTDSVGAGIYFNNAGNLNGKKNLDQIDEMVKAEKLTIDGAVLMARCTNDVYSGILLHVYKLYSDMKATAPVSIDLGVAIQSDTTIDLNGHDLYASFKNAKGDTVAAGAAGYNLGVYVTDTTTNDFVCGTDDYGTLTYEIAEGYNDKITMKNLGDNNGAVTPAKYRYVAIPEGTGYSFHRIYVGVESVSLEKKDDNSIGMGYTTAFKGDAKVKAALASGNEVFGITIGMNDDKGTTEDASDDDFVVDTENGLPKSFGKAASDFVAGDTGNKVTLRVNNILSSEGTTGVTADIRAQTYVKLNFGGEDITIPSKAYVYSLQDVIDALYDITDLADQNAAAAALLADIKNIYGIEATPAE